MQYVIRRPLGVIRRVGILSPLLLSSPLDRLHPPAACAWSRRRVVYWFNFQKQITRSRYIDLNLIKKRQQVDILIEISLKYTKCRYVDRSVIKTSKNVGILSGSSLNIPKKQYMSWDVIKICKLSTYWLKCHMCSPDRIIFRQISICVHQIASSDQHMFSPDCNI